MTAIITLAFTLSVAALVIGYRSEIGPQSLLIFAGGAFGLGAFGTLLLQHILGGGR